MHIAEGVLSGPVLAAGGGLAALGLGCGLVRLDPERIPRVGLLGSVFFVGSLVHVPLGPASVHLVLTGLLGILLGWAAVPAVTAALVLQALLFQYGGFTTLGVNTVVMAAPAVAAGLVWKAARRTRRPWVRWLAAFGCGGGGVLAAAALMAAALWASGEAFARAGSLVVAAHLPLAAVEGLVTASAVGFLGVVKPEVLASEGDEA